MSPWLLYLFVGIGLFGLVCALCAMVVIRSGRDDEDASYGADEGAWKP